MNHIELSPRDYPTETVKPADMIPWDYGLKWRSPKADEIGMTLKELGLPIRRVVREPLHTKAKPYRRRFPLSRKDRIAPPLLREYTLEFSIWRSGPLPPDFLRAFSLTPECRYEPIAKVLQVLRNPQFQKVRNILEVQTIDCMDTLDFLIRVKLRTSMGRKLTAYFANHKPSCP